MDWLQLCDTYHKINVTDKIKVRNNEGDQNEDSDLMCVINPFIINETARLVADGCVALW